MAVLSWSLIPLNIRSAYAPDPAASPPWSLPPVWDQSGDEPPGGANLGNNDYDSLPNWYEDIIGTSRFNPDSDGDSITDSDELSVTGTNPLDSDSDDNGWTDYEDWSGQSQPTADRDGDGADNLTEFNAGTDPRAADTDLDGLGDGIELATAGTFNPLIADTDANGVPDYHQYYGLAPPSTPQAADSDGDGLTDDQEAAHGANPSMSDTDGDTLLDGAEVAWGSSPASSDTDGDGASDTVEAALALLPNDPDTDDDGLSDGFEISFSGGTVYLPNDPDSNDDGISDYQAYTGQTLPPPPADGDNDGLLDNQEAAHGTNPADADTDDDTLADGLEVSWGSNPLLADTDGDSLADATEYAYSLQPANPDTDGDSLSDGYEVLTSGTSAVNADSDEDGLRDGHELLLSDPATNPLDPDTDHDFLTDFEEVNAGDSFPGFNQPLSPFSADSDGDQVSDYLEVTSFLQDSDAGGIPDRIERFYGLSASNPADDTGDLDGDGWTNAQEYQAGHSLNADFSSQFDWDVDGMTNVWEIAHGLNALDHHDAAEDPDGDWRPNLEEFRDGYDPHVADSANSGFTPDGQPLTPDGDGSEWDADWDGDGTSNLDELLDDDTDPTEPDPDPPPACGCQWVGYGCGCTDSSGCNGDCQNPPDPCGCQWVGNGCGCADSSGCSGDCQNPPEPCGCQWVGNGCGCADSNGCSGDCQTTQPCSCQWVGSGCACSTSSQCSGDCYTPPPCTCQWVNAGCTCATSDGCSGDCYAGPCQCPHVGGSCLCTSELECDGSGEMCDMNLECLCTVWQNGGNCTCLEESDCSGDCDMPLDAEIEGPHAVFVNVPATFTTQPSGGKGPYTYQWTFQEGDPDTSSSSSEAVTWDETGAYSVELTVKDANEATVTKTITVDVYEIVSRTVKDPEPRDRTTIGVGEKVDIMVIDAGGIPNTDVAWQLMNAASATLTSNLTGTQLYADDQTGDITVEATIGDVSASITFNCVAPSGLQGRRTYHRTSKTPDFSEAYMEIELTVQPDTVNFEAVKIKEFDGGSPPNRPHDPGPAEAGVLAGNVLNGHDEAYAEVSGAVTEIYSWECDWCWRILDSGWNSIEGGPYIQDFSLMGDADGSTHIRVEKFGLNVDNGWTQ